MNEREISSEDWIVVEKRLDSMPDNMCIGFLSHSLTKSQLVYEVKIKSEIGIAYAIMQLDFIVWLLKQSKIV